MIPEQTQGSHRGLTASKCFRCLANNARFHGALSNVLRFTEPSAVAEQPDIPYYPGRSHIPNERGFSYFFPSSRLLFQAAAWLPGISAQLLHTQITALAQRVLPGGVSPSARLVYLPGTVLGVGVKLGQANAAARCQAGALPCPPAHSAALPAVLSPSAHWADLLSTPAQLLALVPLNWI